ncbi:hypothetical protein GCM10023147_52610 [Tsukamurella soli]|uniref:Uncharacterized protein n=1 Tax=Tsukamurella soli TaxID=644556 RepID=A0ABP8KM26_9ACTN
MKETNSTSLHHHVQSSGKSDTRNMARQNTPPGPTLARRPQIRGKARRSDPNAIDLDTVDRHSAPSVPPWAGPGGA